MSALARTSREHLDRLIEHVERLPKLADEVGESSWPDLVTRIADEHDFLVSTLIPHMETVETAVHPELDRLMSCRLGMAPLEREHQEIRELIERLGQLSAAPTSHSLTTGETIELNRVLVKLYAIVKVHLREESLYVPILEHNLTPDQAEAIAVGLDHASRVEL
jgi:hypothetical protein